MAPSSQLKPALFMTMLMLLSIALAPVSDWSRVIGDERTDEQDGQGIDNSLLEADDEQRFAPADGECWKVLVVPVKVDASLEHRYSKADLEDFLDKDVSTYLDVTTYGSWCADFTVAPEYIPDSNWVDDEETSDNAKLIRNSGSHSSLANDKDFIGMVYNSPGSGGQSLVGNSFRVQGLGAIESGGTTYLCDDSGRKTLAGQSVGSNCYMRGDFLALFAHELLHTLGVYGHGAAVYRNCHSVMGDIGCTGPAPTSSWLKMNEGWYPEEFAYLPDGNTWDVQEIKLRPLNLNLLSSINGAPNSEQIQVVKIPLSSEVDFTGQPDPNHYLLVEYRPKESFNSEGVKPAGSGNADNIVHTRVGGSSVYTGLPSEGVMIYTINKFHNSNPNPGASKFEPLTVIDADPTSTSLKDAAFQNGDTYEYGHAMDGFPYKVSIFISSTSIDATIKVSYETPELNGWTGSAADAYITPRNPDKSGPTWTTDIWVDSPTNNYDIDNADGDYDLTTGVDAIYRWHEPGDVRVPDKGSGDPPALDQDNWLYIRIKNIGEAPIDATTMKTAITWKKPDANGAVPTGKYNHAGWNWQYQQPVCPPQAGFAWGSFCAKNDPSDSYIEYDDDLTTYNNGAWKMRDPHLKSNDTFPLNSEFILGKGEEFIIGVLWKPEKSDFPWLDGSEDFADIHVCLDVRVFPVPDELPVEDYDLPYEAKTIFEDIPDYYPNNWAYENIGYFQVSKSSPYQTLQGEFDVWNSFNHTGNVTIELVELPDGMNVNLSAATLQIGPYGTVTFDYEISVEDEWPMGHSDGFEFKAWIEFNISGDLHKFPIDGGLRIVVSAVEKVEVEMDVSFDGSAIVVDGNMVSQGYTAAGESYAGSVVALEYYTPEGISILRPALLTPGSANILARFDPGTSIDIVYASPSGQTTSNSRTVDANGEYFDSFLLDEQGDWTIAYTYIGREDNTHEWSEVVNVPSRSTIFPPSAEGYQKNSGIGVFTDVFTGTADVPLNDGNWNVRVLFAGDSIRRSTVTENQTVRVEGMPIVHPDVTVGDIFVLDGTVADATRGGSSVSVSYQSPTLVNYRHDVTVDTRDNSYQDHIVLDEAGLWIIIVVYVNDEGESVESRQSINVRGIDVGSVIRAPVIEQITREDTVRGDDVRVGGRLNTTTVTAGTVVTIRAWSPSGVFTTRDVTTDEDLRFENDIEMDEAGRWTIEYEYTDDEGNVMSWGEAIDVEDTEEKEIFSLEGKLILGVALIALLGLILVTRGRQNRDDD